MKVENCSKLEEKITKLRMQLNETNQKINTYHKIERISIKLDEILKNQRALNIKFGLGFEYGESNQPKSNIVREDNKPSYEKNIDSDGFTNI